MTTELLPGIICVEVPSDATHIKCHELDSVATLVFSSDIQDPLQCGGDMIRIGYGNYSIVGVWPEISETDAGKTDVGFYHSATGAPSDPSGYIDYTGREFKLVSTTYESLQSLLQSKSLDITKRFVLLKKS